jgi:hypothetical protein
MIAVEAIDEMLVGRGWMSVVVGWLDDDRAGGVLIGFGDVVMPRLRSVPVMMARRSVADGWGLST